jgi:hypothetical protein
MCISSIANSVIEKWICKKLLRQRCLMYEKNEMIKVFLAKHL